MGTATAPAVRVRSAGLRLGGKALLTRVDLDLAPGTLTALVGPNGAGKSTLLGLIAGDHTPSEGTVELAGRPVGSWSARDLATRRAVLVQDHRVRFGFGVRDVVAMGRQPHRPDPVRDEAITAAAMTTADVTHLGDRDVQSLSGGEAARVSFARVLTQATGVVLLDEPTAALDLKHQESLLRTARDLARDGACVVVVLHDLNLAAGYADRVVVLAAGRVAADGTPQDVLTPTTIEAVYGQAVQVLRHPTRGTPLVVAV